MKKWKGIILAGGYGTRLYPLTNSVSKQLLPVYDKPMIYYSLSVLMLADIRDILIITTPNEIKNFSSLLGDGSNFGINLKYIEQKKPRGLPDAFILGKKFIGKDNTCLILGDNIFYGQGLKDKLNIAKERTCGATIFTYEIKNPTEFGVVEFNKKKEVISIQEKPKKPKSDYAVTGIYFYDNKVISNAENLKPSKRGELEISDLNQAYLKEKKLFVEPFGRGFAWLDTGTHNNLMEASKFIEIIEQRQGLKVACLEEIAYKNKWIDEKKLKKHIKKYAESSYGRYLKSLIK
tara:strand:- start:478 stop:1350 length:873 start_codon:yes stop_codon:yes gene_type:complete